MMRRFRLRWLVGLMLICVVIVLAVADRVGALRGGPVNPEAAAMVGHAAPAIDGRTVAGTTYRWHPGEVTIVDIWASWCEPCRSEVPMFAELARSWPRHGVRIVTIDTRDGPMPARRFLAQVDAQNLVAVHDPLGQLAVSWGATGIPETFVVDATGVIRAHWVGPVDAAELAAEVSRWT